MYAQSRGACAAPYIPNSPAEPFVTPAVSVIPLLQITVFVPVCPITIPFLSLWVAAQE